MGFSGGASGISSANDVALNSVTNSQVLTYSSSISKWQNAPPAGGVSEVMVIKYSGGQYPALPVSKPSGVNLVIFKGPSQPTTGNVSGGIPSYIGDGASQIMSDYEWRNLA